MTIKEIKSEWAKKSSYKGGQGKWQFTTWKFTKNGTCVIAVQNEGGEFGRTVVACISTLDGKDLLHSDHSRPCDNMDDAVDVVGEMLNDMFANGEFSENEIEFYGL